MVHKNRTSYGSRSAGQSSGDSRPLRGRERSDLSLRRWGRYGADTSGERINVSGGRRLKSFRLSGRRYSDMPGFRRGRLTSTPEKKFRYLAFWKPYGVDVKFTGRQEEGELDFYIDIPNVLPVTMLDKDTEGLMVLTNDPTFRALLTHPLCAEMRTFLAQVEDEPHQELLDSWQEGVILTEGGAKSSVLAEFIAPPKLPSRSTPVRERKSVPTTWMELRTPSGGSRGIRKASAAFGSPVLRLVLWSFGPITLVGMVPGQCRDFSYEEMRWVEEMLAKTQEPAGQRAVRQMLTRRTRASQGRSAAKRRPRMRTRRGFACSDEGRRPNSPEAESSRRRSYEAESERRQYERSLGRNSSASSRGRSARRSSSRGTTRSSASRAVNGVQAYRSLGQRHRSAQSQPTRYTGAIHGRWLD